MCAVSSVQCPAYQKSNTFHFNERLPSLFLKHRVISISFFSSSPKMLKWQAINCSSIIMFTLLIHYVRFQWFESIFDDHHSSIHFYLYSSLKPNHGLHQLFLLFRMFECFLIGRRTFVAQISGSEMFLRILNYGIIALLFSLWKRFHLSSNQNEKSKWKIKILRQIDRHQRKWSFNNCIYLVDRFGPSHNISTDNCRKIQESSRC